MQKNNISEDINVLTTTALGVAGAITGNPLLQVFAFFPAFFNRLFVELRKENTGKENTIKEDLQKFALDIWSQMKSEIVDGDGDENDVLECVQNGINECFEENFCLRNLCIKIEDHLVNDKGEAYDLISGADKERIVASFKKCFADGLQQYSNLERVFMRLTVMDHENRINELEKKVIDNDNNPDIFGYDLDFAVQDVVHDDSDYYCGKYNETLFLHRHREDKLTLKDIYVIPEAEVKSTFWWFSVLKEKTGYDYRYDNIFNAVKDFVDYDNQEYKKTVDILFIEGFAAMGKSSMIAHMSWNYSNDSKWAQQYLGERRLIVVKLRDMPDRMKGELNMESPFSQIKAYLQDGKEDETLSGRRRRQLLSEFFKDSMLVLEGFDELCMICGEVEPGKKNWKNRYFQKLHDEIKEMNCNCKVIVTSRPDYLNVENLDFPKAHMIIRPFGTEKRKEWIGRYVRKQEMNRDLREILLKGNMREFAGIIDSPLTLYMVAARNIQISSISNLWSIYHEIFAEEIYERNYDQAPHAVYNYQEKLYRLTSEIAYRIVQEKHLSVTLERLLEVGSIRNLLEEICEKEEKDTKMILEDCFALASYFRISWKKDADGMRKSAVEFYHNNIRDFFFCEYIWMQLEEIYADLPVDQFERDAHFLRSFQNMFQYTVYLKDADDHMTARPVEFLRSKVRYLKESGRQSWFVKEELENRYFQHFFGEMLKTGFLYSYQYTGMEGIMSMMTCIFSSVYSVYHAIYVGSLERLAVAEDRQKPDISTEFIFQWLFLLMNIHDFRCVDFDGIMFSGTKFEHQIFRGASFCKCQMLGCIFEGCDLRYVDFRGASLQRADFSSARIDETTLFSDETEFEDTVIHPDQMKYFEPWLGGKKMICKEEKKFCISK